MQTRSRTLSLITASTLLVVTPTMLIAATPPPESTLAEEAWSVDPRPEDQTEEQAPNDEPVKFFDATLEELFGIDLTQLESGRPQMYGFVRANVERVFQIPSVDDSGTTVSSNDPLEWSDPSFHLYSAAPVGDRFYVLLNLAGSDDVEVRNAYGNIKFSDQFQLRFGKMYRRFGLFSHKLDQFPTFLGIEPPELFDKDHLLLPRTTLFAVHGVKPFRNFSFLYFVDTANGEAGAEQDVIPLGWDFRLKGESLVIGTSGYLSSISGGGTTSTVALGDGSPRGGVLPWMTSDEYLVYGGFVEYGVGPYILQGAYWRADHTGVRDPDSVLTLVTEAGLTPFQRARFLGSNAGKPDSELTTGDVVVAADYIVETFYLRAARTFATRFGTLTPYLLLDWMKHPEAIRSKTYGGDNEAGFADDGEFWKPSIGMVFNPTYQVALKLDASAHKQEFNGKTEIYPEVRFDVSFAFQLLK